MHHFMLERGDTSGDGHEKTSFVLVRSSLSLSETMEAYRRGVVVLGHDVINTCCVEHEDTRIPDEVVAALIRTGWDLKANADKWTLADYEVGKGLGGSDVWFGIYLHVVRLGEPAADMAIIPNASIDTGGYGLES
jgi:hypothetical protein